MSSNALVPLGQKLFHLILKVLNLPLQIHVFFPEPVQLSRFIIRKLATRVPVGRLLLLLVDQEGAALVGVSLENENRGVNLAVNLRDCILR